MCSPRVTRQMSRRYSNTPSSPGHPGHQTWQCGISSFGVSSRTMFTSHHFQRHYQNCENASTSQSGTSHATCLRGFGGNGSIAWTSAVSHEGRTSNAFKVTMKLQAFLFQMVVTSCISVQYLWKYGFAKSPDNLYATCRIRGVKWKGNVSYRSRHFIAMFVETIRTCVYQVGNLFLNELIVATREFRNYKRKVYNTSSHLTRPRWACQRDLNAMIRPHWEWNHSQLPLLRHCVTLLLRQTLRVVF